MQVRQDVLELQTLDKEIKRVRKHLRTLHVQYRQCEARILSYLETTKQPGVRLNGMIIKAETHTRRKTAPKKIKAQKCLEVLSRAHVNEDEMVQELLDAMKGTAESKARLKLCRET